MPSSENGFLRTLGFIVLLLVLILVAGSVYGLATGTREKKLARLAAEAKAPEGSLVFTGIGTIRASTNDSPKAIVVATIAFPYPAGDKAFEEELEIKRGALKAAAEAFFSRKTAAELQPSLEGGVKIGLREAFNELLSLGEVEEIWLSDYSVVQ